MIIQHEMQVLSQSALQDIHVLFTAHGILMQKKSGI